MQDNDGWEWIGEQGPGYSLMEKVPKWVLRKMRSMDMRRIESEYEDEVHSFYPLRGRRYSYRIFAYPAQGGTRDMVLRKRRDRSRATRRHSRGSSKTLVGVLVIVGAVLLAVFLMQIL